MSAEKSGKTEISGVATLRQARISHLLGVANYLNIATMAIWGKSERAEAMLGMFEASIRWPGPDGYDEDLFEELRNLFGEAKDFHDSEEFAAMMARLRVGYDLVCLRIIEVAGDESPAGESPVS